TGQGGSEVRHVRRSTPLLVLLLALSLVAAACGGGGGSKSSSGGKTGGKIVVAAEQWPKCINPVTTCQNSSWLHWTLAGHVLPRLMEVDLKGNFVASPLLTETPSTSHGGIKQNPFTIPYHLNPKPLSHVKSPPT